MHGYRVDNIRYKQVIISAYQAMKGKYSQVQGQIFGWGANMAQLQMGRAGCSGVLEVSRSAKHVAGLWIEIVSGSGFLVRLSGSILNRCIGLSHSVPILGRMTSFCKMRIFITFEYVVQLTLYP